MKRSLRNFLAFAAGFLLAAFALLSHADTIPATPTGGGKATVSYVGSVSGYSGPVADYSLSTLSSLCTRLGSPITGASGPPVYQTGAPDVLGGVTANSFCGYWSGTTWTQTQSSVTVRPVWTCPSGNPDASGNCPSSYTCPSGYTLNGTSCTNSTTPCPSDGTVLSSGYYDYGVDPAASFPAVGCAPNGCNVIFSGTSPAASRLVNGQTHYYAKGEYDYGANSASGGLPSCTPGTNASPASSAPALPTDSCGPNSASASMNGKTVCYSLQNGLPVNSDARPNPGSTTTINTTPQTTNPDGSKSITTTKTAPDGSKDVNTTTVNPDGSVKTTDTVTPGPGGGLGVSGSGSGSGSGSAPSQVGSNQPPSDYCSSHPTSPICVSTPQLPTDYGKDATLQQINKTLTDADTNANNAASQLQQRVDGMLPGLQPDQGSWTVDALGLPSQSTFQQIDTTGLSDLLPSGSDGGCVPLQVQMFGRSGNMDFCPIVEAAQPFINWGTMALFLIATWFSVLGIRQEGSA